MDDVPMTMDCFFSVRREDNLWGSSWTWLCPGPSPTTRFSMGLPMYDMAVGYGAGVDPRRLRGISAFGYPYPYPYSIGRMSKDAKNGGDES